MATSLDPPEDYPSRETREEEVTGIKESEVESIKSEDLGVRIQYGNVSKKPANFPQLNKQNEINLRWTKKDLEGDSKTLVRESSETVKSMITSILMKILPEEKQDAQLGEERESRGSPKLWSLTKNPRPEREEQVDEDDASHQEEKKSRSIGNEHLYGCGYMRGFGTTSFYNREYAVASEYLDKEFRAPHIQMHFQIDAALMRLECDIYRHHFVDIDERLEYLKSYVSSAATISLRDLLRWAEELRASERYHGSFVLCLIAAGVVPENGANAGWHFNLCYYLFVEMSLRAVQILSQLTTYSVVAKFILGSLNEMICKLNLYLPIGYHSLGTAVSRFMNRKIAVCHLAVSYCCNCVGFNKSAERYADAGIQMQRDDYFIKRDLLVNKTASFVARRKLDEAHKTLKSVLKIMDTYHDIDGADGFRVQLITEMKNTIWEMMSTR